MSLHISAPITSTFQNQPFFLKKKHKSNTHSLSKKDDVLWTFEEEYLFFEAHKILKNKWTKYSEIFPHNFKEMKELKNHFHSCIIKTVRRIINNKYDYKIKEIMRSFYACEYLQYMIGKLESNSKKQKSSFIKTKFKYNPKMLISQKMLTIEMIQKYMLILLNEFFLTKPSLIELLGFLHIKKEEITVKNIFLFFTFLIKTKIIIDCKEYFDKISPIYKSKIQTFINENFHNSIDYFKLKKIFSI